MAWNVLVFKVNIVIDTKCIWYLLRILPSLSRLCWSCTNQRPLNCGTRTLPWTRSGTSGMGFIFEAPLWFMICPLTLPHGSCVVGAFKSLWPPLPLPQFPGSFPHLSETNRPSDDQWTRGAQVVEGDPHMQEQVSSQEQGTILNHLSNVPQIQQAGFLQV